MKISSTMVQLPVTDQLNVNEGKKDVNSVEQKDGRPDSSSRYDEYIHSEEPDIANDTGIYSPAKDENGESIIKFTNPDEQDDKKVSDSQGNPSDDEKNAVKCTVNTDSIEAEIKELKEERKEIQKQINQAADDPDKKAELEKQLSDIEAEIKEKDNDTYKKQHASYTNESMN